MNENNNIISIKKLGVKPNIQPKLISQIIVIGDKKVGKTTIIKKFLFSEKKIDLNNYIPTDSFELLWNNYLINEKDSICLQFWDTTGNELYQQFAENFYKNCYFVFFIYSLDNKKSFLNLNNWIEYYKKINNEKENIFFLIGNKSDLENKREISYEEGLKFSKEKNFNHFIEINTIDDNKIENLINFTISKLYNIYLSSKEEEIKDKNIYKESEDSCVSIEIRESKQSLLSIGIKKDEENENVNNYIFNRCCNCILS